LARALKEVGVFLLSEKKNLTPEKQETVPSHSDDI
jgi:hypothetical protein